jgi:hypothetical protein
MNPAEPGHPAQPLKVGTNLTGELTVTPYGGELKARFVQPAGVRFDVWVGAGVGVGGGVGVVEDMRVSDTGLEDIGILARETDGTAPIYLPVRVSCRVHPPGARSMAQESVP